MITRLWVETQSSLFDFSELWKIRQILSRRLTFSSARGHNKLNGTFGDLRKRDINLSGCLFAADLSADDIPSMEWSVKNQAAAEFVTSD